MSFFDAVTEFSFISSFKIKKSKHGTCRCFGVTVLFTYLFYVLPAHITQQLRTKNVGLALGDTDDTAM